MGLGILVTLFANLFAVFSWPSFTLIYPLYASIRAIESDSESKNRQCLTYWVVFACVKLLDTILGYPLEWLPFWLYVKGVATFVLATQCFGGAFCVYNSLLRPYLSGISLVRKSDSLSIVSVVTDGRFSLSEPENSVRVFEREIIEVETHEPDRFTAFQENRPVLIYKTTHRENTRPVITNKVQREWCCALCLLCTTGEKCLIQHFRGKKHNAKVLDLMLYEATKKNVRPSLIKNTGVILVENCCKLLTPVTSCTWRKPRFGCTKLNTDGSIDSIGAGFGGLLRDHNGDPICGFVSKSPVDTDNVFSVEIWAIWRGIVLALGLGIRVIWVESDSLSVVNTINRYQSHNPNAITFACLERIWELMQRFDKCVISHSWRETNAAADYLAKMDLLGNDLVLWPNEFPKKLCKIIKDDARGRIYNRG